jgi:tetratricopeptide (TPR) repeat protein
VNRYLNGERSADFLIEYGLFAKLTRDTTTNHTVLNELIRAQPPSFFGSQTSYLILFRIMMDVDNPLSQHLINNLDQYKQYANPAANLPSPAAIADQLITNALIVQLRGMLEKIGVDPLAATGRTVFAEISAYFREKATAKAVARFDTLLTKIPLAIPYYIFFANQFNTRSPDVSDAPSVVRWMDKALADSKATPAEQADLQAERAEAYRRMGQKDNAKDAAKKALERAQTAKVDTRRFEELIRKLNTL